jgi:hypothetical protein
MTARSKHKTRPDNPPPRTGPPAPQEGGKTSPERPRPPEPFEECGPTGAYGGSGMKDEATDDG